VKKQMIERRVTASVGSSSALEPGKDQEAVDTLIGVYEAGPTCVKTRIAK
jgi:hypothetical protein